jgi:hypothetical protein
MIGRDREGGWSVERDQRGAAIEPEPQPSPLLIPWSVPDLGDRLGFRVGQAVGISRLRRAAHLGGIVGAQARIGEKAVGRQRSVPTMSGAGCHGRVGHRSQLGNRDRLSQFLVHDHLAPEFRRDEAVPVERGGAGHESVVLLGMALCHHRALPAARRASGPIAEARSCAIKGLGHCLSRACQLQFGAFGKVLDQALVQPVGGLVQGKSAATDSIIGRESGVACIGRSGGITAPDGIGEHSPGNGAGISTAADTAEAVAPRPRKRQPNFNVDRRGHDERDLAESRQTRDGRRSMRLRRCRNEAGRIRRLEGASRKRLRGDPGDTRKLEASQALAASGGRNRRCRRNGPEQDRQARQSAPPIHVGLLPLLIALGYCVVFSRARTLVATMVHRSRSLRATSIRLGPKWLATR